MEGLVERVREFCSRIGDRVNDFDFNEKRLALQALQIKVVVGKDDARLQGAIPTHLATTARTSACQFNGSLAWNARMTDCLPFERLLYSTI
ncbi:MAG: hypothetical protein HYY31_03565 [Chloroflexi bacterium]|nr:hypothetical protein [Chloroflexota bacterium]